VDCRHLRSSAQPGVLGYGQAKGSTRDQRGPNGDALYSNTTLALDPDTGVLKWHFQNAPGETLDLDEVFERVLIDHGAQKTVMTVGKSGLMWKLDRVTGKFLDVKETVFQNVWASIDMKTGRTTYRDDILEKKPGQAVASCPSPSGGHNWQATSYDPANDLLLLPLSQNCAMYGGGPQLFYEMPGTDGNLGRLSAYETNTMRPVWSFQQRSPFLTGVISTAGGVGFVGDFDRTFRAFDVKTGRTLWETRLPTTAQGYPVTFSVGGDQFVAVPTGYKRRQPRAEADDDVARRDPAPDHRARRVRVRVTERIGPVNYRASLLLAFSLCIGVVSGRGSGREISGVPVGAPFTDATKPIHVGQGQRDSDSGRKHALHLRNLHRSIGPSDESPSVSEQRSGDSR
jgi:glucose dehydrogenase